jgi:formylmethanofuran dehydrogenase subunit A
LLDLDREYSLQEIAIVTRAAPARLLGLKHKGHLGVGADADITIYDEHENREEMFKTARYVLKDGHLFIKNHEFCADPVGRIYQVAPDYDKKIEDEIRPFFDEYYSVQFDNYPVFDTHVETEIVPTYPVQ